MCLRDQALFMKVETSTTSLLYCPNVIYSTFNEKTYKLYNEFLWKYFKINIP